MEKMRITDETANAFYLAAQTLVTEILALNLERTNEEIIDTYKGFSNDIAEMAIPVLDKLREDQEFISNSNEFMNAITEIQPEEENEDSEAVGV